jgi:hypothetical protein
LGHFAVPNGRHVLPKLLEVREHIALHDYQFGLKEEVIPTFEKFDSEEIPARAAV